MLLQIRPALVSTLVFTLVFGLFYPLAVTGIGALIFPVQASGSLIRVGDHVVGSRLLGQTFSTAAYLHPRPSAAGPAGYDPMASGGSNLGPLSPDLATRVARDAAAVRTSTGHADLPPDAVTASGSGLDPDISPAYALLQAERIAAARRAPVSAVRRLIAASVRPPLMGFLGQPRVNVLETNIALDKAWPQAF